MQAQVEAALESLAPTLAADGFELKLDGIDADGAVSVALTAAPDACLDCLVPDEVLVEMIRQAMAAVGVPSARVRLHKRGFG